jgi:hypothetical protein
MWSIFKQNILNGCSSYAYSHSYEEFAMFLATEYELALKRGGDTMNGFPIGTGNKELFVTLFIAALERGYNNGANPFNILEEMKGAIEGYWTGAVLASFPNPTVNSGGWPTTIPAIGSVLNIGPGPGSNSVTNPGEVPPYPTTSPTDKFRIDTVVFCNNFVNMAKMHLNSVSGIISTISLYPTAPTPTPAPGIISWSGYLVPE